MRNLTSFLFKSFVLLFISAFSHSVYAACSSQVDLGGNDIVGVGNLRASGNLQVVSGGNLTVSGNTSIVTASITGAATLDNNLSVGGTTTLIGDTTIASGSDLTVTGNTNLKGLTIASGSDLTVEGKTILKGVATLSNNLSVSGTTLLGGNTTIDGNSNLTVGGETSLVGLVRLGDNLSVAGTSALSGNTTIATASGSKLTVGGETSLVGLVRLSDNLSVAGTSALSGNTTIATASGSKLTVEGETTLSGNTTIATASGSKLTVEGETTLSGNTTTASGADLTVGGETTLKGVATLEDTLLTTGVIGVNSPSANNSRLRLTAGTSDSRDNSEGASIDLHNNQNSTIGGRLDLVGGRVSGNTIDSITFWTGNSSTTQRMSVTAEGTVKISDANANNSAGGGVGGVGGAAGGTTGGVTQSSILSLDVEGLSRFSNNVEFVRELEVDGATTINNSLSVTGTTTINSGSGQSFTLPSTRGDRGARLVSDGSGATNWSSGGIIIGGGRLDTTTNLSIQTSTSSVNSSFATVNSSGNIVFRIPYNTSSDKYVACASVVSRDSGFLNEVTVSIKSGSTTVGQGFANDNFYTGTACGVVTGDKHLDFSASQTTLNTIYNSFTIYKVE